MATRRWSQPVKMVVRHVFTGKTTPEFPSPNRWNKHVTLGTATTAAVLGGTLVAAGCYYRSQSRSDQGSSGGWTVQASSSSAKKRVLDPIAGASVLAKLSARERRFVQFASTEHNGQLYMTPQDFLESVIEAEPRPRLKRKALSEQDILRMHKSTPPLKKGSSRTFRDLRDHGIISYTEYLFLLSILTKPQTGFRIAFNMFDTDGNSRVEKEEFLVLLGILCHQMYKEETMRGVDPAILEKIFSHTYRGGVPIGNATPASAEKEGDDQGLKVTSDKASRHGALAAAEGLYRRNNLDTTLLVHLFGKSGKHEITYEDFCRFMDNLQTEVLELEFLEFSKGLSTITELDFAKILLRYTQLSPHEYDAYLNRLLEGDYEERGITFAEFKDFCTFLNNLDDFAIAMRMYTLVDKPISQEEFQRAVKICTGTSLNPHLVQTVFLIFDEDGDNRLSDREFIAIMRDRVHRGLKSYAKNEGWDAFKHCVKHEMKSTL